MNNDVEAPLAALILASAKEHPDVREAMLLDRRDSYDLAIIAHSFASPVNIRNHVFTALGGTGCLRAVTVLPSMPAGASEAELAELMDAVDETEKSVYVGPRNETERELLEIWRRLLRLEHIGVADDFIALGGDSATVVQLGPAIQEHFGVEVEFEMIFEAATVRNLAVRIEQLRNE